MLIPIAVVAGCLDEDIAASVPGKNETLEIQSNFAEAVTLHITIEKGEGPSEEREVVFEDAFEVPAKQTVTRDVLGDNQYYIAVRNERNSTQFGTRPICDIAFTRIIVTDDGHLLSRIKDCE